MRVDKKSFKPRNYGLTSALNASFGFKQRLEMLKCEIRSGALKVLRTRVKKHTRPRQMRQYVKSKVLALPPLRGRHQ